jgi:hypothetical protein
MISGRYWLAALTLSMALAQAPLVAAPGANTPNLAERAAKRFPQPVRVGDLIGRQVLEPTEAQHVLGRVASVVRHDDGRMEMIVRFGGMLGIGTRLIAVPIEAVALLGEYVTIIDFTPEQLQGFPTTHETAPPLSPDNIIRVGLAKPFH